MSNFAEKQRAIESQMKGIRDKGDKEKFLRNAIESAQPTLQGAQNELDKVMRSVAHAAGVQNAKFKARIKPMASIVDKVMARGKGFGGMADLVAGMILVNTQEEVDAIVKVFSRKMSGMVVGIENKEKGTGGELGYYGSSHVDIRLPQSGVVAELQLMTKKLEAYKKPAHDIYSKYRSEESTPKGEAHQSRMLFAKGNKRNLREWLEELLEAFGGGYQRGGNPQHANRTSARDEQKMSKADEIAIAEQSPIFRKHTSPTGWKFVTTVHAAARAFQRRLDFEFQQWKEIHDRVAGRCDGFDKWKKGDNFVLFYSKSYQQGYVTNVYPDTKTIRIITVLPKGKNLAPAGTAKVLVENYEATEEVELQELTEADVDMLLGLNEAAGDMTPAAPEGMTVSKNYGRDKVVPKIGDWVSYKVHYSMLSSAGAFQIIGFSGKATLIVQEYEMKDNGSDHRVLTLDPSKKKATAPLKLRIGSRGDIEVGTQYADFHTKEEVESKGIKYSGSRYD